MTSIHIVCPAPNSELILARKARLLANATGWTISGRADPKADINYLFPYLENRSYTGPIVAYFTHREDIAPVKVQIWREQAQRALLRITSARQYEDDLKPYGETVRILPPLDRGTFAPRRRSPNRTPVVGVSGYVYGGGRKGEKVLRDVLPLTEEYDWRAVGRGWPVHTVEVRYKELPGWYNSLDVYVCPSLIEGIPYGPLEALACGVKVVIPRGVGLLDDLPDLPGIQRYDAGDAQGMAAAIREVMGVQADRDALRATTEPFTEEGWINGHLEAFASLDSGALRVPVNISGNSDTASATRGIYVVAYGDPARECAEKLIASVRKHMSDVPVAVAGTEPLGSEDVFISHPDADLGGRTAKTKMYELTPPEWEQVLYLDADTELTADVSFLFDALTDGWDMAITKDQDAYDEIFSLWRRDNLEMDMGRATIQSDHALQLAGGVVAFQRNDATKRFFRAWHEEWKVLGRRDQGALIRAFYSHPVRALVLGNEWNSFTDIFTGKSAGITHHRGGPARRQAHWGPGRLDRPRARERRLAWSARRRAREAAMQEKQGVWFIHAATGSRQHAIEDSPAYNRFMRSPHWAPESEHNAVQAVRAENGGEATPETPGYVAILCPAHGVEEQLPIPGGPEETTFQGQVNCLGDPPALLRVVIANGVVEELALSEVGGTDCAKEALAGLVGEERERFDELADEEREEFFKCETPENARLFLEAFGVVESPTDDGVCGQCNGTGCDACSGVSLGGTLTGDGSGTTLPPVDESAGERTSGPETTPAPPRRSRTRTPVASEAAKD